MQWLYNNLVEDATLTPSTTLSGYDVESLKNYHLSKIFRFNTTSGNIVVDLGSAINIDNAFVALFNGSSVTVQANSTNVWTSPAYSTTMTSYSNDWFGQQKMNKTYRYWRFVFTGGDTLAYLYLGDELQLPGINPEVELAYNTTSSVSYSVTMQTYGDKGINYFSSSFEFPIILDEYMSINNKIIATREDILTFWYENQGVKPFILLIFEESLDRIPPFMAMINQNSLNFKLNRTHAYWNLKFTVTETK